MLTEISIHNYKSVREVRLTNLPAFLVLIGANAAGKSNFADALDFLSLAFRTGLAGAVRAKGGYENICFRRAKRSKSGLRFGLKAAGTEEEPRRHGRRRKARFVFAYDFAFLATKQTIAAEYEVTSEKVSVETAYEGSNRKYTLTVERMKNAPIKVVSDIPPKEGQDMIFPPDYLEEYLNRVEVPQDELLFASKLAPTPFHVPPFHVLRDLLVNCKVYQISPHVARETGIPERSPDLGRHGENLPAAVAYLKASHPQASEELLAHLRHTVPTIEKLETGYVETKALGLFFKERGAGRRWFSQDVSDGTIQTVSIFLPLVDPRNRILVIDEPENSLHPWILRHFVDSCKIHSADKQIFLATQSLVAVDEAPLESLYIVTRHQGETHIERCVDRYPEARQVIAEQLMGLGEYWDTGAVAGVPEYGEQLPLFKE